MDNCPPPSRVLAGLQALKQRILSIGCIMHKVFLWTGWSVDTRPVYAALQSRVYSGGMWSVTWLSTPGQYFSIQQSIDGVLWLTVGAAVQAADSPAKTTTWHSPAVPYQSLFFRIVTLPAGFVPCYVGGSVANLPGWDPRNDVLASLS